MNRTELTRFNFDELTDGRAAQSHWPLVDT